MRKNKLNPWILSLMSVWLVGCSSPDPVEDRMYLLPVHQLVPVAQQSAPLLMVKTELAAYLNQPGLVYRTSQTEVIQARHNQWAQRISDQITQRIIEDLRAKQTTYWPVAMNTDPQSHHSSRLIIRIQKFNGVYTGEAEIAGEWTLRNGDGQRLKNHYFNFHTPLSDPGYSALVGALSNGLGQFTDTLVAQF